MSEWTTYRLGDVSEKIGSGATPRGGKEAYLEFGKISLIRSQNVLDFSFSKNGLVYISEEQGHELRNVIVKEGDVLLNITGDSVARVCQVPSEILPARVNQHVAIIRGKSEVLNQSFVKYYLLQPSFKRYMLGLASAGATRNALTKVMIENFEIKAPEIEEQQQIASILFSLDDKIELNQQMNQTMQAMAQAIFKEWFVDFNFPGFDGELVDGLPKKWRMGTIGEIAKVIDCLHSKKPEKIIEKTGNIFLQLNNILDNGLLDVSDIFWISNEDYKKWISRIEISQGDCVITNVGRVGAVARIPLGVKAALGRNMTGIRLKEEYPYPGFLITLLKSDMIKMEIEHKKDIGTILEALNVKNIPNLTFPIPTNQVLVEFEIIVSKIWDKMEANTAQNLTLTQIRDNLLPKLMTGKIEIKE